MWMLVSLSFRPKPTVDAQDIGVNYLLGSISLAFKSHSLPVNGASQYPKAPFVLRNQTYGKRKSLISSVWKSMETKRERKVLCFSFLSCILGGIKFPPNFPSFCILVLISMQLISCSKVNVSCWNGWDKCYVHWCWQFLWYGKQYSYN